MCPEDALLSAVRYTHPDHHWLPTPISQAYRLDVDPPDDAIETAQGTIWLHEGILIERTKAVRSTVEMAEEAFNVYRDLGEGSLRPFLFDIRNFLGSSPKAVILAISRVKSTFSAVAALIDPESASGLRPYLEAIGRLLYPVHFFTDEEEALAWLRGFLPPESSETTRP